MRRKGIPPAVRATALASLLIVACASGGCLSPSDWLYVGKLGYNQLSMSLRSRPLTAALSSDSGLTAEEREKLTLVIAVKEFCREFGLDTSKVYDSYSTASDRDFFLLAASERLCFQQHVWNWPIIGPLPYKGFFDENSARREGCSLEERGLDVYVGRAAGYSTLGWFSDPFLPMMFRLDRPSLIQMVIHETTHRNIFRKGFPSFNEGVATLIARQGALLFVARQSGRDSPGYQALLRHLVAESEVQRQVDALYRELDEVYTSKLSPRQKAAKRQEILAVYRPALVHRIDPEGLNNAWILLRRLYTEHLSEYEQVHAALGGDLERTVAHFRKVAEAQEDPDGLVAEWLALRDGLPPAP